MRRRLGLACGLLLVLVAPTAAAAQGRNCALVQEADFRQIVNARGETVVYFRDPVRLRCEGGVTLAADSAIYNRAQAALELVGSVSYQDTTNQLTADWANYLGRTEQLLARGSVVLTDLRDGSVVTGDELQYLRQTLARPRSHVIIRGGRPRAILRESPAQPLGPAPVVDGPDADTAAPVEITADRLEFVGDTLFLARGSVDLRRGATTGAADSARYSQPTERMTLLGRAHVRDERYRLEGERIDAFTRGEALREVRAEQAARLESEELTVESERLRIGFAEGALERLEAWNPRRNDGEGAGAPIGGGGGAPPSPAAPGAATAGLDERALAIAEGFRLRADSIDAIADSGRIREVRAIGRGYGERRVDSLAVVAPGPVSRDWIQGDTIIGYFAALVADTTTPGEPEMEPAAEADSTGVVLERIVVIGGGAPALSLYRLEPAAGNERGAINFMKASRIILFMSGGEVARVEAEGPIDGVYLDPVPGRSAPAGGPGTRGRGGGGRR